MTAPMSISSLSFGSLVSTTLMNYRNTFYDNVHNAIPIFYMLRNRKRTEEGGERIVAPLAYAKNSTFKSIAGYEAVDTTPQDPLTSAYFNWKEMAGSMSISREEENKNRGKYQVINLLQAKVKIAEMSAAEELEEQAMAIATASPSKDLDPINYLVQKLCTGSYTVGNINQSTYTWWRNQYTESSATTWAGFLAEIAHLYNKCSKGGGAGKRSEPDWIICDQGYYELYESAARDKSRIVKYDDTIANLGFGGAKYKNAVFTWDEYYPDYYTNTAVTQSTVDSYSYSYGGATFLNRDFIEYVVMAGSDLDVGPFIQPENQVVRTALIYNMANLVISNRRKQGVHHKVDLTIAA